MSKTSTTTEATDKGVATRILETASRFFFSQGVDRTTMDDISGDLGMSKKTLYLHFPGKDAIIAAIIDGVAARMQTRIGEILDDRSLDCAGRLCLVIETIGSNTAKLTPAKLRDLQRNAPAAYAKIDAIRRRNIPMFFGRIIRDGITDGAIRGDVDPTFATEFWLQAMRGMLDPETLERTELTPQQTLEKAVDLFFRGLLTPAGREQFTDHKRRCAQRRAHAL